MYRVPKIMATVGPTLEKPEDLCRAIEAGARGFRLPFGYRQRPHLQNALDVRAAADQCRASVELLIDLPSSRPRTGNMADLLLEIGARVRFFDPACRDAPGRDAPPEEGVAAVPLPRLAGVTAKLARGHRLRFCDGRLEFLADEISSDSVLAHLVRGAIPLKASNSISLPDTGSPFTMLTAEDPPLLAEFAAQGVVPDWVALSLVSSVEDVRAGREAVRKHLPSEVRIMAKIERAPAVERAEAILREADGIMVARGDLGPNVDFIRLPEAQEQLVEAGHRVGKPVVVATQILEYFAEYGVPQRSELSGLSLLAHQAPHAILLCKETAYSPRPVEVIRLAREVMTHERRRLKDRGSKLPRSLKSSLGRPYVVAVEGPNGSGKSHLCALLRDRLDLPLVRGVPAVWEDAPQKLRMIRDADWLASAMYFLSGVMESSREAKCSRAEITIMDRSLWSTLAVHYAFAPERLEILLPLMEFVAGRVKVPDLTIVLEASPAACQQRIARKAGIEQTMDAAAPATGDFERREREFYHWLAAQWPQVRFLDTENSEPESVYRHAIDLIRDFF